MINRRYFSSLAIIALLAVTGAAAGSGKPAANSGSHGGTPSGQAFTLLSIKHEIDGPLTRIMVESNAPPLYSVFRPSDHTIVIDLPGGDGSKLASEYPVKSALVDNITVKNSSASPGARAATRIVVNVKGNLRDRSALDGNTLVLELVPDSARAESAAARTEPASLPVAPERSGNPAVDRPGARVYPVAMRTENSENTVPVRPARLVRSIRTEQANGLIRVLVDTDGLAQYKDFTLTNPSRIVLDVRGVRSEFGNKTVLVNQGAVERVRVGEPSSDTVRVVIDSRDKVPFRVSREGASLVISVGQETGAPTTPSAYQTPHAEQHWQPSSASASREPGAVGEPNSKPSSVSGSVTAQSTATSSGASKTQTSPGVVPANIVARAEERPSTPARSSANVPAPERPNPASGRSAGPVPVASISPVVSRATAPSRPGVVDATRTMAGQQRKVTPDRAFCDPGYVGGPISFDLRAGVDIRDMLRFISQQYGVNFIVDESVKAVPVELRITDVPWNQVILSVMRANRLGWVCEDEGRIIRIATLDAVREEQVQQTALKEEKAKAIPLETVIRHLKYARASGSLAQAGGQSKVGGGSGGQGSSGSLLSIVTARLSGRGKVEVDGRTNSLIITDLPENIRTIEAMVDKLDRPEPQVEIEARIVVADRNFLRDLGVQLGTAITNSHRGSLGVLETAPITVQPGGRIAGQNGGSQGSGSTGSGSATGSSSSNQIAPGLPFALAQNGLQSTANTVLGLTTGLIGTNIISAALSASETKGQIRTISTPRITAQDNQTAEIVNGVQIPVQTVSNNTVTTTFITAALRLQITPQIVEETGEVTMHVVAENNTVNQALANQFNGGTPGINTQSAESIVRVKDGGTAVMGGINIDNETQTENRTPGISKVPLLGELFKRRTTSRDAQEILFFITPRIVRSEGPETPAGTGTQTSSLSPSKPTPKPDDSSQPLGANGTSSVVIKTASAGGSN